MKQQLEEYHTEKKQEKVITNYNFKVSKPEVCVL